MSTEAEGEDKGESICRRLSPGRRWLLAVLELAQYPSIGLLIVASLYIMTSVARVVNLLLGYPLFPIKDVAFGSDGERWIIWSAKIVGVLSFSSFMVATRASTWDTTEWQKTRDEKLFVIGLFGSFGALLVWVGYLISSNGSWLASVCRNLLRGLLTFFSP